MVGYGPGYGAGDELEKGTYKPDAYNRAPQGKDVIGYNESMDGSFKDNFKQGGWIGRTGNHIPGINATAHLHDYWMNNISSFNLVTNVGTMLPAAAISYGSSFGSPLGPTISTTVRKYADQ